MNNIYVGPQPPNYTKTGYWVDTTTPNRVVKKFWNGSWNTPVDAETQKKVLRSVDEYQYQHSLAGNEIDDTYDKNNAEYLFVNETDIADNLTTNNAKKVLSAKQGKLLNEHILLTDEDVSETTLSAESIDTDNMGDAHAKSIDIDNIPKLCGYDSIIISASAPTVTPDYIGQMYIDTTNEKVYVSTGVTNAASFKVLN